MARSVKTQPASRKSFQLQHKSNIGRIGEDIAASFLLSRHFRILDRNFVGRYGELDIVAVENDTLVVVEVKTRSGRSYGTPQQAVTRKKVYDVVKTAQYYVQTHPSVPRSMRIDVVAIVFDPEHNTARSIDHIRNITMDLS